VNCGNLREKYNGREGVVADVNGLYYMRARYYSPELKRFLNVDTKKGSINKIKTLNLYSFVIGNPLSLIDPAGMSAELDNTESAIGFTNTIYSNMQTLSSLDVNGLFFNSDTVTKAGFKTTVGNDGKLITVDQFVNGTEYGTSYESSNTSVEITGGSISIGQTVGNVTTSFGFDSKTGSFTTGTETVSGSGDTKYVVSTETTYTSNLPKLAQEAFGTVTAKIASTAHNVSSDFQQASSAFSSGNYQKGSELGTQAMLNSLILLAMLVGVVVVFAVAK